MTKHRPYRPALSPSPPRPPWRQPQLTTLTAVLILLAACVLVPWAILGFIGAVLSVLP